jgi:YHS domain-containing protein
MKRRFIAACAFVLPWGVAAASAQHADHQMPGQQPPGAPSPSLVASCVASQRQIVSLADLINGRLEEARQSNSPQQMRAALADLQAALVEIRTRAGACSPLQDAAETADPHAGHVMPQTPAPTTSDTPAPPPAPSAAKPGTAKAADPHAGHTSTPPAKTPPPASKPAPSPQKEAKDPVCGKMIDPAKAPSATYKGQTHYFCSAADRLKFIRNPETYVKKEQGRP